MNTEVSTYSAIRMATGKAVHIRNGGSSITACGAFIANTRQYKTEEKVITCKKCAHALTNYGSFIEALQQGFTTEVK